MNLSSIKYNDIITAGSAIAFQGVDKKYIYNNYWIQLPDGKEYPFKLITREAYKIANNTSEELDFSSTERLRSQIKNLGFLINYYPQNLNFFKKDELELYKSIAGTKYRKGNVENTRQARLIQPLIKKVNLWTTSSEVEDFVAQTDNSWQWSGTFKSYLWIRVYRQESSQKVYFVFGIDKSGKLYFELNCQRSNHSAGTTIPLPEETIVEFDKYMRNSDYTPKYITVSDISNYNWSLLIELTQSFIYKHANLYDELESICLEGTSEHLISSIYTFKPEAPPSTMKSYASRERKFKGIKTDWLKKQYASSQLGRLGEEFVLKLEKSNVENYGYTEKAEQVCKKLDGEGYDILSYDESGSEIFIEVKTTKGGKDEPFYISANERAFCELNPDKYFIYRLFNYNFKEKVARYFIIKGNEISDYNFIPTIYEVSKTVKS